MTWAELLGLVFGLAGTRRARSQTAPRAQRWVGDYSPAELVAMAQRGEVPAT